MDGRAKMSDIRDGVSGHVAGHTADLQRSLALCCHATVPVWLCRIHDNSGYEYQTEGATKDSYHVITHLIRRRPKSCHFATYRVYTSIARLSLLSDHAADLDNRQLPCNISFNSDNPTAHSRRPAPICTTNRYAQFDHLSSESLEALCCQLICSCRHYAQDSSPSIRRPFC